MSEELLQTIPLQIGKYTYLRLGNATLAQLRAAGHIPNKQYPQLHTKKPDGLVLHHNAVKAVVEYKQPSEIASDKAIQKAIEQELEVAKNLCKLLILTDGSRSFWVNALNGERVKDANGNEIIAVFHPFEVKYTDTIEYLIEEIDASLAVDNSQIRAAKLIDPTPLAKRLWQTIWVATGKSPVKCLYNVVELFIFKFLSDLKVLPDDIAFESIYRRALNDAEDALDFYARNTRIRIEKLFPAAADGTTIINGTIFVAEDGQPNLSQSILFRRSLDHLHRYAEEFGSLTRIDKRFKTKLYESFLKEEVEALGQYFTPRKVIQCIIRMAGFDSPSFRYTDKRICDPFCGVGGFLLEMLNLNENMMACYSPSIECKIHMPFVLNGFDKGFERDDERTIILAKANMLIYLAEILFANPSCSQEFARVFNETFRLFRDNLGTFGHVIKDEAGKYDYILSNPPYVTSGSSIIKEEIKKTPRTAKEYPVNALGLEGLSLEWIVKSLRRDGSAYIIVPDGILGRVGGKKLRDYILQECYLNAIVSLPVRTFFANWEHTYILVITKKKQPGDIQTHPVFTYLVSNIGERLTSVMREEIADDDLPEVEGLFRMFMAAPSKPETKTMLEKQSGRCKIHDINKFRMEHHWVIDRWWTRAEKVAIGAEEDAEFADKSDVDAKIAQFDSLLGEYDSLVSTSATPLQRAKTATLGDTKLFRLFIGKRLIKKNSLENGVPTYSANVYEPMGYLAESNIADFNYPSILWGIDGNFDFNLIPAGVRFGTTDHCGTIQILDNTIDPEYLLYALILRRSEESFDRSFRASLTNMRLFQVEIPVNEAGEFDLNVQRVIASRFTLARRKKTEVLAAKKELDDFITRFMERVSL